VSCNTCNTDTAQTYKGQKNIKKNEPQALEKYDSERVNF
jgi:hypothetical protein